MNENPADIADEIISQIEQRMESTGMTKAQLAHIMGVTPGYVSHLFKGRKRNLTLKTLTLLGDAVGMEVEVTMR